MKLYEIPEQSQIRVETTRGTEVVTFQHVDGMYSLLTASDGEPLHLLAWAELKQGEDGVYELIEE